MSKERFRDYHGESIHKNRADWIIDAVKGVAEPLCLSENMEFVHAEYLVDGGGPVLRIYLDKPGGIGIDDCVYMNRQLGDLLDIELQDIGSYRLEISSPGPRRPLTKPLDFERFRGESARVEIMAPSDTRKRFTGVIDGVEGDSVTLLVDGQAVMIKFDQIKRARLSGAHGEKTC
ncbi:MAG: ribosome maturation factor RimP [Desulfamplus sp.]|nr:ribosome maturation factor RimP [Desulfamplus sp.]